MEKKCNYCVGLGRPGLRQTEDECFIKKRAIKRKREEDAIVLQIKIGKHEGPSGAYQYDTAASHHTTNELWRLANIETGLNLPVKGHNGTISICTTKGTAIFKHNGRTIKHLDCLYDPTYSNIISGQRMPEYHTLEIEGRTATLSSNHTAIYKMTRDTSGALWISPDQVEVQIARVTARAQAEVQRRAQRLHEKYGHISFNMLKTLPEYRQLQLSNLPELPICQACQLSKTTKPATYANQGIRTSRTLERLHTDCHGY